MPELVAVRLGCRVRVFKRPACPLPSRYRFPAPDATWLWGLSARRLAECRHFNGPLLQDEELAQRARQRQRAAGAFYDRHLHHITAGATWEAFRWAVAIAESRAFALQLRGGGRAHAIVPLLDFGNHDPAAAAAYALDERVRCSCKGPDFQGALPL